MADLLDLHAYANDSTSLEGYHGLTRNSFSVKQLGFGYDVFIAVMEALRDENVITVSLGDQTPAPWADGKKRQQTRFSITPEGLRFAANVGLQVHDFSSHWQRYRGQKHSAPHHNIHLKKAATYVGNRKVPGEEMDFIIDDHLKAATAAQRLKALNDHLRAQSFGDVAFLGLRRIFNNGDEEGYAWNKGGRFYSIGGGHRYESWSARKRQEVLRINGEVTAEVDLKASHLTLLYALKEQPFDASADPYEIDGFPRALVKAWVTKSLGVSHAFHRGWPDDLMAAYERERPGCDLED